MLWETVQQLTDLPPIPHETRRFIAAFVNLDQDINQLAEHLNEDFFDIVQRLCDPAIKSWIVAINALKNNERRERALRTLDAVLSDDPNPNNTRRASTRILRHLESTRRPAKQSGGPFSPTLNRAGSSPPRATSTLVSNLVHVESAAPKVARTAHDTRDAPKPPNSRGSGTPREQDDCTTKSDVQNLSHAPRAIALPLPPAPQHDVPHPRTNPTPPASHAEIHASPGSADTSPALEIRAATSHRRPDDS